MLQTHGHGTPPLPSPARLGLLSNPSPNPISSPHPLHPSNPNKPSPPLSSSSIPQSNNSSSNPSTSTSTSTSTSLLSLLPPFPRAQSLLLQMSSLSSRLFDLSPNRSLWSSSYRGSLPSFLPNPSNPNPSSTPSLPSPPSSTKELLSVFHSLQTQLFESVSQLQEILNLQNSAAVLSSDIRSKDSALLSFTKKLKESESVLDSLIDDYSDYRCSRRMDLDLNEVLAYAHKISYTTFAPPEHGAGLAPLRGALPPAPQDNEMRASQLYHFADLDVGVPKRAAHLEKGKDSVVDKDNVEGALMEPTPPREELPVPGIVPAMLPITVPAGWKPGDPVALPPVVPPIAMPVGWKPGDPVPLPPLDEVVGMGVGKEEAKLGVGVGMGRVAEKAPEVIQVKHVTLDIDQEYDSSDYSSDGSSDEEDDD